MRAAALLCLIAASALSAGASSSTAGGEGALEVRVALAAKEAPESFQVPVTVTVVADSRPVVGAVVNLSSSPTAAFVPSQGETGTDGGFRSVMLTPAVSNDTVVAVIARATFKGGNLSFGSAALLVWPEDSGDALSASVSISPKVLRAGEEATVRVNVSGPGGERVENATVVLLAPDLLELAPPSGSTSPNGSFLAVVRARTSDSDRYVEVRAQAFKRGMKGAEDAVRIIVARSVSEVSLWERAGGWIVLAVALLAALALFLVLHYKYVRGPAGPPAPSGGSVPAAVPGLPQAPQPAAPPAGGPQPPSSR